MGFIIEDFDFIFNNSDSIIYFNLCHKVNEIQIEAKGTFITTVNLLFNQNMNKSTG